MLERLEELSGVNTAILAPVIKTAVIGILTHICAGVCSDSGENGIAKGGGALRYHHGAVSGHAADCGSAGSFGDAAGGNRMRRWILILVCAALLTLPAAAVDVTEEQAEQFGIGSLDGALEGEAAEVMPDVTAAEPGSLADGLGSLFSSALSRLGDIVLAASGRRSPCLRW